MNGTMTSSAVLTDSVDSLASARLVGSHHGHGGIDKRAASQVSRAYKQASQFFLQRRFPECLFTVQPLIQRKPQEDEPALPAPIATASRAARVKVWSLYITLLNSIVELGPEDGKNQFGNVQWRLMERKVRDGSVWEEVVQNGYGGMEGNVDPDVVSNLATLLLSQCSSQALTQQRLEAYLAASSQPNLDMSSHFDANGTPTSTPANKRSAMPPQSPYPRSGTDTPRDLNSRIKILELYALHVLPRNDEWAYAREFVSLSAILDEDTREEFLQTLTVLEDEHRLAGVREQELQARAQAEEQARLAAEKHRMVEAQLERSSQGSGAGARRPPSSAGGGGSVSASQRPQRPQRRRSDSERDYGIDSDPDGGETLHQPPPADRAPGPSNLKKYANGNGTRLSRRTPRRQHQPPQSLVQRGAALMQQLHEMVLRMAASWSKSPAALLQTLVFLLALLLAVARQDVRERIVRLTGIGWEKLKRTIGMGVKVSYI